MFDVSASLTKQKSKATDGTTDGDANIYAVAANTYLNAWKFGLGLSANVAKAIQLEPKTTTILGYANVSYALTSTVKTFAEVGLQRFRCKNCWY